MMLRRDHDVLHAGVSGELDPVVSVEFHRIELTGERLVVPYGNLRAVHDPLAETERAAAVPLAAGDCVQPPMDEEAVLRVAKPLEAFLSGRIRRPTRWFLR